MPGTVGGGKVTTIERSCALQPDSVRYGEGAPGLERIEAYISARGFEPHRHDTYGVGLTTAGVQAFRYRGERRICLPGQLHVLHPDELHDGTSATEDGFRYRIVYLDPELLRAAIGGQPLPFVADPVQARMPATRRLVELLTDIDQPISDLERTEAVAGVADALTALSGSGRATPGVVDRRSVAAVRDYLEAHAREQTTSQTLERIAGMDRFAVARQFRRAYGTSPDRYRTLRRLGLARTAIESGTPIATAAVEAGFADQSHLTRQFRRAYGFTPRRWAEAVANGRPTGDRPGQPAGHQDGPSVHAGPVDGSTGGR
jgi:AraC-like DNA-binding protein